MKKKFLAFALAASLLLVLVGCGEDRTPANDGTGGTNGATQNGTGGTNGGTDGGTNNGNGTGSGTDADTGTGTDNGGLTGNGTATDGTNGTNGGDTVGDGLTGGDAKSRMGNGDTAFTNNYGSTFGHSGTQVQNERMPGTVYDGTQWSAQQTATWSQMLDNGFVHDGDGYLLDGENSSW